MNYDWEAQTGRYYDYFTSGVACSEVEVDMLTGAHHIISTDIIMDVGNSLNPAIDIGQVCTYSTTSLNLLYIGGGSLYSRGWVVYNGRTNFS